MQSETLHLSAGKKAYFVSDFHLGAPHEEASRKREKRILQWLDKIAPDAEYLFLLGDIFDFWFEYAEVVPKGYVRLLAKLAFLSDAGVEIRFFPGNHDMWTFGYFEKELNWKVYKGPQRFEIGHYGFYLGHGDGLGPGDNGYKRLKKIFSSPLCQRLFAFLHPSLGMGIARFFSRKSRAKTGIQDAHFESIEKEMLVHFCRNYLKEQAPSDRPIHYFIFGHRHLPLDIELSEQTRYINTGDWFRYDTFAEFSQGELRLIHQK